MQSDDCSGGLEPEPGSLTDDPAVRAALNRIVIRMEGNLHTREDLLQEALVYLWLREQDHPGQRLIWYLQGVKFHLNDFRNAGRSLDASKRKGAQASFPDHCDEWDHWLDSLQCDDDFQSAVNAHDILALLVVRLKPLDQRILGELAQGEGIRDLAGHLDISHQSVLRGRERIADWAIQLGVVRPTHSPDRDGVRHASVR